jgi:putative acetyltransferase
MAVQGDDATALRPMLASDIPVLAAIFQASVEELTEDDYDETQRLGWSALGDEPEFGQKLAGALTIVATRAGAPVGFATLAGADRFEMLYVFPRVARQGIGSLLCDAIEKLAQARGAKILTVDASDTAKPLFDRRGYVAQSRQTRALGNCWLGNTRMTKTLA